ncbi:MAG: geranylgeranylglycerol-phosphate geranylgeranyltransferase [Chitinivibrionales bacterium]
MNVSFALVKIVRPANALLTGAAVVLGFWLAQSPAPIFSLCLLVVAAMSAVGFGNVINDIKDIDSDRVSHPDRPLPKNELSRNEAIIFAFFCGSFSLANAFLVSPFHGLATLAPLVLLCLYAFYFKATPLAGNVVVSFLVAYPLLFGGLTAPRVERLLIPALLAFLLNVAREIVKDFQDKEGDAKAGMLTTAALPENVLKAVILTVSALYLVFLFVPFALKQFGIVYCIACAFTVVPMHLYWSFLVSGNKWALRLPKISSLIKFEMLAGLLALAADQVIR